jgi:ankyrin repeat protein
MTQKKQNNAALWESVRDVNETDERGRTLLYVACRKGDAHFARRALELSSGDTVNFTNVAGKHALYAAAAGGDEHVVELVVKAGAALEKKDRQGRGALWAACYHLRPNAVARLLCLGADPNARDYDGTTPLIAAAAAEGGGDERRNGKTTSRLRLKRARETTTAALTFSDPESLDLEARERLTGCTALWAACASGSVGVALELIAAGADVDAKNAHGRTPLLAAALGGHCEIALALAAAGADVDAADDDGETPLYAAAFENHPATVAALVASGADVDGGEPETAEAAETEATEAKRASRRVAGEVSKNENENENENENDVPRDATLRVTVRRPPPLVGACWRGNAAAVAALLSDGPGFRPDLERVTSDGRTALTASCWRGNHACARLLLAAGAEVDHADADGRTALWAAARAGDSMSISLCVERGGDVDKKDARRDAFSAGAGVATCTPLFAAVWQEEHDAVRALLAAGADPREGDGEGRAPLSLVDRGSADHTENTRRIREMLLDAVAKVEKSEKAARSVSTVSAETFADSGNGDDDGGDERRISALEEARALRLERADAQARRAAAWVRKREARARAADEQALEEEEDEDEDDSDREEGSAPDASAGFESGADDDFATGAVSSARANEERRSVSGGCDAEIMKASRRARVSLALRRRAARGAKRVARALAAFRDASRAARDAERRSTVMLRPADVEAREVSEPPAVVDVAKSSASSSAEKRKKTPNVSAVSGSARRRAGAEKHSTPAPSPEEVARLVALADDTRVAARRALHARAFEIRNSLADLPDALERLRARAATEAPAEETKYSVRDGRDARRSKPGVAKRLSAFASARSSRTRSSIGSFVDFDASDEDDGAFNGRARVESRATAAVLGSE